VCERGAAPAPLSLATGGRRFTITRDATAASAASSPTRVVDVYYRLLAATLVALVLADVHNGMWALQAGRIHPYRHVPIVPLYGRVGLVVEWAAFLRARPACGPASAHPRAPARRGDDAREPDAALLS
jgi:hypothetical protein